MSDLIGFAVARYKGDRRLTLFHLIESEIADRKVTRCGRELHEKDGTALTVIVWPPNPDLACHYCRTR